MYSTMFFVSNNRTGTYSLVHNMMSDPYNLTPVPSGNLDNHNSICEIIDCSIMFYHSVAYKYVVMIADLRDNISHLSNILIETKHCRDEVLKNLEEFKNSIEGVSSAQDEVLRELSERFLERKNIFAVRILIYFHCNLFIFCLLETFDRTRAKASLVSVSGTWRTAKKPSLLVDRLYF